MWIGALPVAGCRVTAATATCGECCRAFCRSDAVATVAQVVVGGKEDKVSLPRENRYIIRAG